MPRTTITEALAELKVLDKRILKKQEFIGQYLVRPDSSRDPLLDEGGSRLVIARELQAIEDLCQRVITIRKAIWEANWQTPVTVGTKTQSIAEWLIWRRDVAPALQNTYKQLSGAVQRVRQEALRRGVAVVTTADLGSKPTQDFVVNVDEKDLASQIEEIEAMLGQLDGQLSLKNATVTVEV